MTNPGLHYSTLIDNAMRGMVRDVLKSVAADGLPGAHHFYITFRTDHPGTRISDTLKSRYPEEMTIVLQHQFWDFKVEDSFFTATLSFGGVPEKLVIPYNALVAFADPSVKFGLQFQAMEEEDAPTPPPARALPGSENGAEILSLDAFRKK